MGYFAAAENYVVENYLMTWRKVHDKLLREKCNLQNRMPESSRDLFTKLHICAHAKKKAAEERRNVI